MEKIDIRSVDEIRYIDDLGIVINCSDFRGRPVSYNLLDFSDKEQYNIIMRVYNLGKRDVRNEIKNTLGILA